MEAQLRNLTNTVVVENTQEVTHNKREVLSDKNGYYDLIIRPVKLHNPETAVQ